MTADDVAYAVDWQRRTGYPARPRLQRGGQRRRRRRRGHGPADRRAGRGRRASSGGSTTPGRTATWAASATLRPTPWSCATLPILGLDPLRQQRERSSRRSPATSSSRGATGCRSTRPSWSPASTAGCGRRRRCPTTTRGWRGRSRTPGIRTIAADGVAGSGPPHRRRRRDRPAAPDRPRLRHGDGDRDDRPVQLGAHLPRRRRRTASARPTAAARSPPHPAPASPTTSCRSRRTRSSTTC